MMKLSFAAQVNKGPRETNDDRLLVGGCILDMTADSGECALPALVAVCDGCGGYHGGGIAAQTVLTDLAWEDAGALLDKDYLTRVLEGCEEDIQKKKQEQPQLSRMCTTVAGCVFGQEGTVFFHSGDSRVYRCDKWGAARMTKDHSLVQRLVDLGQLSPEQAQTFPDRNVITRCMGNRGTPPELYASRAPIRPGEKYLFCSDGLWEWVDDETIGSVLDSELSLEQMVEQLVQMALDRGGDDNISVCICSLLGEEGE